MSAESDSLPVRGERCLITDKSPFQALSADEHSVLDVLYWFNVPSILGVEILIWRCLR